MLTIILLLFIISSSIYITFSTIINDEVITILATSQTKTVTLFIGRKVPSFEGVVATSKISN